MVEKGKEMVDNTEKEEYKNNKAEMLEAAKKTFVKVGKRCLIGGAVCCGTYVVYTFGKYVGIYGTLSWAYHTVPESAEAIKQLDPAFFEALTKAKA